ncbi:MAG: oleate hydratase [Janthinobacterium lividum]
MVIFNAGAWGIGHDDAMVFLAGDGIASMASATFLISCLMPFITSQFRPRGTGYRSPVLPSGTHNLAFIVGDSVRSAQMAVQRLPGLQREAPPAYQGKFDPSMLPKAFRAPYDVRA